MSGCAHMNRDELCAACALPKGREWKAKSLAAERHCAALEAELVELRAERDTLRETLTKQEKYEAGAWLTVQELRNERDALRGAIEVWQREAQSGFEELRRSQAEVGRLRADLGQTLAEVERPFRARAERAEAALREIEQATEGIPEQNCMLANRIARLALLATAPAEGFFARGDDGH